MNILISQTVQIPKTFWNQKKGAFLYFVGEKKFEIPLA